MSASLDLPLVVYRGWQLARRDSGVSTLYGLYKGTSEWAVGDTVADCDDCGDETPGEDCGCGLHGYCQVPSVWANTEWVTTTKFGDVFHYEPRIVFGSALLWGSMRIGTKTGTVRAQYGSVLALLDMGSDARRTAAFYRVPTIENERILRSYSLEHGQETAIPRPSDGESL